MRLSTPTALAKLTLTWRSGGGVLDREQGFALCQMVIAEWALLVQARCTGQLKGRLKLLSNTNNRATFRWDAQPRPCSVAEIWRPADQQHLSNGVFVTHDSSRAVFLECLHSECQNVSRGRGIFLGYLPSLTDVCTEVWGPQEAPSFQQRKRSSDSTERDPSQNKYSKHLTLAQHSTTSLAETSPTDSAGPSASRNSDVQPSARIGHNPNTPPAAPGELHPDVAAPCAPQSPHRLTQQQGLLRVYSKNQTHGDSILSAWTVETDMWRGRHGGTILQRQRGGL